MALKLEKIKEEKKANKITFLIKGSSEAFANTVRRLIVEEVPTLAIEDVEIKDNDSALYDEMLALRAGLVPIKTDIKSYRLPESQAELDERSARCTLQIKLKASKKGYVYAEDAESSDPKCTFVYPKMPIVKLLAKQKVDVTMIAHMGQGKDHVKWAPGWAFYKKEPIVKVGKLQNAENVLEHCTDGVFTGKGSSVSVNQDKVYASNLLEFYSDLDEGITIDYSDNIIFTLESWGQLSHKDILKTAAGILTQKAEALEAQL